MTVPFDPLSRHIVGRSGVGENFDIISMMDAS